MKRILYVEKTPRAQSFNDSPQLTRCLNQTKSEIEKALEDFSLELDDNFGIHTLARLAQGFDGLLTHFPYERAILLSTRKPNPDINKFYRALYCGAIGTMKEVRAKFPSLSIVVYTGAATGDADDSRTNIMDKIITESGANRVVYRSNNLANDAETIRKHFVELLS